jgi:16S rRNA G527 N7-methylase RsmG
MATFPDEALRKATAAVLDPLIAEGGSAVAGTQSSALVRYVTALAKFGAHTDMVGARTAEALVEIALADAIVLARRPELLVSPIWEIGAGGASLTIPLAVIFPEATGTLYEPRQKRATFLRMAIGSMGLAKRLTVVQARVEPEQAPVAVAGCALGRAVFAPDVWIPMASKVVFPRAAFAVLTTQDLVAPSGYEVRAVDRYELPITRARRVATWLSRIG